LILQLLIYILVLDILVSYLRSGLMNLFLRPWRPAIQFMQIALIILLAACARQGFPPGGPVDRTPPRIMATWPLPDTTRVPLDSKIFIQFNEAVDHRTCIESIFITPRPAESALYKWHGNKLEIEIPGGLLPNRTYVITIGTGTRDRRNIALATSQSLAFSTGDSLDHGALSGKIYSDAAVEGVQIWAYELASTPTPNPATTPAIYVTQANSRGEFALEYLALGAYRIFAVGDRDLSGRYDAERELLGVASRDYTLSVGQPRIANLLLRAALRDTTPPALAGASALDNRHVDLRFSERMADRGLDRVGNYRISSAAETLQVLDVLLDKRNPAYIHLLTSEQKSGAEYALAMQRGWDLTDFALADSARSATFKGAALGDSLKPYFIAAQPEDKARNVVLQPILSYSFSEAMDQPLAECAFALLDSGKTRVPGRITWRDGAELQFQSDSLLRPDRFYLVKMAVDSLRDRQGNRVADTLLTLRFQTLNPDTLSEISGSLRDGAASRSGKFFLNARIPKGPVFEITQDLEGTYRFGKILPGDYLVDFYRDEDGNGRYSFGQAWPYKPAERFAVFADTIKVRARWPNEGNDLLLPE
jgi:hypothetical protein